jgi:hypothetical protein
MSNLSVISEAIRHYKLNSGGGYAERSKFQCTDDYKMHVPSIEFNAIGPVESKKIIFGWLAEIGVTQALINIIEFALM